jgi:hypothetical protein
VYINNVLSNNHKDTNEITSNFRCGPLACRVLSSRGTHTKSVLGIQLVKVKYFFLSYVVWKETSRFTLVSSAFGRSRSGPFRRELRVAGVTCQEVSGNPSCR